MKYRAAARSVRCRRRTEQRENDRHDQRQDQNGEYKALDFGIHSRASSDSNPGAIADSDSSDRHRRLWLTFIKYKAWTAKNNLDVSKPVVPMRAVEQKDINPPRQVASMKKKGFVSLVGSGPGDPDLLTLKALRCLQQADVVVYDRLVSDAIMDLIPHGVSRISVGKSRDCHTVPQPQINQLLVDLADSGRRVVRLKGGDPYLFGRGSEEALELRRHDIDFEVVPGITAASGVSSYAGIPLTHRGLSHNVRFVTGQLCNGDADAINWRCFMRTLPGLPARTRSCP